jgi:hypothetical protein
MEPKPIAGIVKDCKVICEPQDLKEYDEGTRIMLVSEKLFSNIIRGLGEMEEDLNQLKELKISLKVERMEKITRDLETKFKALSYREYLGEDKDIYLE